MKWIAIKIMKMIVCKAKNDMSKLDNAIMKSAYSNMIKSYETTIMFLEANNK